MLTAVLISETFTGLPAALVIVEAVVDGVTVPVIVTVPRVAVAIFTLNPAATFCTVTMVLESDVVTVPKVAVAILTLNPATALLTVTSVDVRATLTGFATAFVIVEAVVEGVTVPLMVTVPSVAVAILTLKPGSEF